MKADLTRGVFPAYKAFTRVVMQQGRVQLDADWNEQAEILLRTLRTFVADVVGPCAGPANPTGFAVGLPALTVPTDFAIAPGHYYVDGILCENDPTPVVLTKVTPNSTELTVIVEVWRVDGQSFQKGQYVEIYDASPAANSPWPAMATIEQVDEPNRTLTLSISATIAGPLKTMTSPRLRRLLTYTTQPDYPLGPSDALVAGNRYQVYLDVWERLETYVEDPSMREVALGGADTTARTRLVCQVRVASQGPTPTNPLGPGSCATAASFGPTDGRGLLRATAESAQSSDPCIVSPGASYTGPENQLYRVEIHSSGHAAPPTVASGPTGAAGPTPVAPYATFKWSRENGAVVFPIASGGDTSTLALTTLGRDDRFGLAVGDWVEVVDDDYTLRSRAGALRQVLSIDAASRQVTLSGKPDPTVGAAGKHPYLRRWDQTAGDPTSGGLTLSGVDNAALVVEGTGTSNWLDLEDGIRIQFRAPDPGQTVTYRTGDYWLIPARTATGNIEWPTEQVTDAQGNPTSTWTASALRPAGVTHHYAPLAVIDVGTGPVTTTSCQTTFAPIGSSVPVRSMVR
jgi:hypothetical protein